jgi:hypothetical protein
MPPAPPRVRVVATQANLGFAGGCNLGIQTASDAGAELVLLLNSDAVAAADAIDRLEDALRLRPDIGIAAPLVVSRREPGLVASAGIRFSTRTGRMRHHAYGTSTDAWHDRAPTMVGAASGCALLVRRTLFDEIGLFNERYFFSFEDIEFCVRAARAGWRTVLAPSARVYHEGHASIGAASTAQLYFGTRNHLLLAASVAPGFPTVGRTAAILLLNMLHALRANHVPRAGALRAVALGAADHFRGRYGAGRGIVAP